MWTNHPRGHETPSESEDGTKIFAQYVYEEGSPSHIVSIVGWDDNFPVSAFTQGHESPAPGAWIVKNSWADSWGTDSVLQYVSAMTGMLDTEVTAEVYLLDQDAKTPTEGILLETVTDSFRFAGYHRMTLPNGLAIPAGSIISIVTLQRVPADQRKQYAFGGSRDLWGSLFLQIDSCRRCGER